MWVRLIESAERAEVFNEDELATLSYVNLVDIIATLKPEDMKELPTRSITIVSTLDEGEVHYYGSRVELKATLENFCEDDRYDIQWFYSEDQGEQFNVIDGADSLCYEYVLDPENINDIWRIMITLYPKE